MVHRLRGHGYTLAELMDLDLPRFRALSDLYSRERARDQLEAFFITNGAVNGTKESTDEWLEDRREVGEVKAPELGQEDFLRKYPKGM